MRTKVGELVQKAKGDDRSLREYSRQSGVDAAIISKIINGEYTPKKHEIYRKLTSPVASPKGGVTFEQLIEAVDDSKSYQAGLAAGAAFITSTLGRIGAIPVAKLIMETKEVNKCSETNYEKLRASIGKFVAIANGIVLSELARNRIYFQLEPQKYKEILENDFDTWLSLERERITELLLRYVYLAEEDAENSFLVQETAKRVVERLVFLKNDMSRQVCILTNSKEIFGYLASWKDGLSYNGYLSIVLINTDVPCIGNEECLSNPGYSGNIIHFLPKGNTSVE